mgnify:CR=1 FL=1
MEEYGETIKITPSKEKPDISLLKKYDNEDNHGFIKNFLDAIGFKSRSNERTRPNRSKSSKDYSDKSADDSIKQAEENTVNLEELGIPLDENAKKIYEYMEIGRQYSVDSLVELGIDTNKVVSSLTILEISRLVNNLPGGFYEKIK